MNSRERFLRIMSFKEVDRYPYFELGPWPHTFNRWVKEGLVKTKDYRTYKDWMRGETYTPLIQLDKREFIPLDLRHPIPSFYKVLEKTDEFILFIDDFGAKCRGFAGEKAGTSMFEYQDYFVKKREDFLEMKKRLNPNEPSRYPQNWNELKEKWKNRDYPLYLTKNGGFGGLYWNLREWMGTERLSYAFFDQPDLVHEMLDFWVDYFIQATEKALHEVEIDAFIFNEDIAYKNGPLISPKIYKEFFLPRHRAIVEHLRKHGVKVIELDSDGNTEPLLPLMIEAGINCHWPLEAAAGMDPVKIRKEYGKDLALSGGIDKRALSKGKAEIEEELRKKIIPMLETGGYIPTVDHTIPPDISLENALYYFKLKREIAEGKWK